MGHTNQQPFRFDLCQAPQQKLPKASYMFELRKDRFDDHFRLWLPLCRGLADRAEAQRHHDQAGNRHAPS